MTPRPAAPVVSAPSVATPRPNVIFVLVDQLRASSLPTYGEGQIETPHLDRLAADGVVFDNAISTCAVCTPYRAMLVTGRHPQTTGMLLNFVRIRHDEIGIADAFGRAGYRTGWVGKWHMHTGSFPQVQGADYVPEGRDRLGFQHWRGYNFHSQFFNGWVNKGDWRNERWEGYETSALLRYAFEFIDGGVDRDNSSGTGDGATPAGGDSASQPFMLVLAPHQPHHTPFGEFAPAEYYARLPEHLTLPENVPAARRDESLVMYRHYLAMTLAIDDMVGQLLEHLERNGQADNTLIVFTSDHGTQGGAHDRGPWDKMVPHEESLRVPLIVRLPGILDGGTRRDALMTPVDFFPTLCGLCDVPVPRSVEGHDLSAAWRGEPDAFEQDAVLTMNFTASYNHLGPGTEWRGVRTKTHSYSRWLDGTVALYDITRDPMEQQNLVKVPDAASVRDRLEQRLQELMLRRADMLQPCASYQFWYDAYRRVVRNSFGPLGDPEDSPDWSLLA
jgi:arylsulfatase A-like enzyme